MVVKIIVAILIFIHILFVFAVLRKKFDIMDIGWGTGPILISVIAYLHYPLSFKNVLILSVVAAWGLRLALHIFGRNRHKGEDLRYTKLRENWKPNPNLQAYFKVFLFQGVCMLILTTPIFMGMTFESRNFSAINWLGLVMWFFGFTLEVWADYYLIWFKKQSSNQGKICMSGPWSLCRFPNYLGEVTLWYGIYFLCFEPQIAWTIVGPMLINILILKVTGVPPLEEHYKNRPSYLEYSKRVPRFLPFTRPKAIP